MGKRKLYIGEVISNKMSKTIIVRTMRISKHPKYGKVIKKFNKFKVHDEEANAQPGDTVLIEETRPLSKDKHFRLKSIIKKAETAGLQLKEGV
jgi:small subunit ribosomal protein S17